MLRKKIKKDKYPGEVSSSGNVMNDIPAIELTKEQMIQLFLSLNKNQKDLLSCKLMIDFSELMLFESKDWIKLGSSDKKIELRIKSESTTTESTWLRQQKAQPKFLSKKPVPGVPDTDPRLVMASVFDNFRVNWESNKTARDEIHEVMTKCAVFNDDKTSDQMYLYEIKCNFDEVLTELFKNLNVVDLISFINKSIEVLGYPVIYYYLASNLKEHFARFDVNGYDFFNRLEFDKVSNKIGIYAFLEWIDENNLEMNSMTRCRRMLWKSYEDYLESRGSDYQSQYMYGDQGMKTRAKIFYSRYPRI